MKKLLLLIMLIIPLLSQAQYFSGEITYQMTVIPKSDTVDLSEIMSMRHGVIVSYIIKSKQYKATYYQNGEYKYSYTYDDETKRMFDDHADQPYLTFRDSRKSSAKYYGSEILKDSTKTILGYKCYLVISKTDQSTSKTYYTDDLKINYADFEGHKIGNWYDRLKAVGGAISIKTINEYATHYEINEAIKIDERKVKEKTFKIPDKPVAASFEALDQQAKMKQPTPEQIKCYQDKVGMVSKPEGEKYTSYISFFLQKNGEIKFVAPLKEDHFNFYKVAVDIVKNCGFQFDAGTIQGEPINSQIYFPVEFLK